MLINQTEGREFQESLTDPQLKHLLTLAESEVFLMEEDPHGEFDMLFFSKVLSNFLPKVHARPPENLDDDVVFG
jgi:hypothetical protein